MKIRITAVLVAFVCVAGVVAQSRPYRAAAEDAVRWVRASAVKTNAGVTWPADPADQKSTNTGLYSGSPGVVLFLLELHHATGKREYLDEARAYLTGAIRAYDISPDGRRFLMVKIAPDTAPPPQITIVSHWFDELRARVKAQ